MSQSTKPSLPLALHFVAGAPDSRITELLLDTAITHIVPGPSATLSLPPLRLSSVCLRPRKLTREKLLSVAASASRADLSCYHLLLSPLERCTLTRSFFDIAMESMCQNTPSDYRHITTLYWSVRLFCCLQRSVARQLLRKYSTSSCQAAKGLHFSNPHRAVAIEHHLPLLSMSEVV